MSNEVENNIVKRETNEVETGVDGGMEGTDDVSSKSPSK